MNAPPGFESDLESEEELEDEVQAAQQALKNGPKFSGKALIKEPEVPGAPPRPSRKLTLGSWMSGRKKPDDIDQLADELQSPAVSPTKLKKRPQLEELAPLLTDDEQESVPQTQTEQSQPQITSPVPNHSEELGQFLGVLDHHHAAQIPAQSHAPPPASAQNRPTWIPTHAPTLAAYDATWSNHPPVPTWHPDPRSPSTPLPGFSTVPSTPGYPPPFYPHPPSLQPYHPYGENGGYYAPPVTPVRMQHAQEYLPNPWSPPRGPVDAPGREGVGPQPRSRTRTLVRRMMSNDESHTQTDLQSPEPTRTEAEPHGTLQTITTCIGIAKELQHAIKGSKGQNKHQRVEHTLTALHKLVKLLKDHRHHFSSARHHPAQDTNDLVSDVFRYLKSVKQYITPGIVMAVIYLVKDWLENGFSVKSLIKSATEILEEVNSRITLRSTSRPALPEAREERSPPSVIPAQTLPQSDPVPARRKHRPPSPSSTISELELPPRGPDPSSAGPSRSRESRRDPGAKEAASSAPPVPPPRSSQRPAPSQSAIDALKAKQKLQIERMRKTTERMVRLPPVGDLPQEDVKIHDDVAEMDEAARELANADSGPKRETLPVEDEKKGPSKRQVDAARELLREPTPLRGVIAADDVVVDPPVVTRDDNNEPDGVEAETVITPTKSRPETPLPSPIASRPPSPVTPIASPAATPLVTPFATPPDSPVDIDDVRDQVEDEQAVRRLAETQ